MRTVAIVDPVGFEVGMKRNEKQNNNKFPETITSNAPVDVGVGPGQV
jgi:hypothetical protein